MKDNPQEMFDQIDEHDRVIGQVTRRQAHSDKTIIHRSVAIAILNGKREIFLQKRSETKDTEPGKWTISCSGHAMVGKYYEESAHRELMEELGVDLKIHPKERLLLHYDWETEMTKLFVAFSTGPFTLDKDEISDGRFFSENAIKEQVKDGDIQISKLLEYLLPYVFPASFVIN